ncbi:MAG TPA: adenylyltransferase/cytidyltransferase family protein [Gemmatimonadales bacterium]|nr:adenylyltransferase/cytidyltransferase family protein [Gemmatimonadales bacterium]
MTWTAGKVRTLAEAQAWREGQRGSVVFTNGVFDLLHPGHVELLEAARAEGEALVVGVNGDASARRLGKGPGRPVASEAARARVLAALAAVDCVVLFDDDTPRALIDALHPDVLAKGADYARDAIVGADLVEARGGRVVRIPLVPDQSSTRLVERARGAS